jgi:hypothetical protein
VISEVKLDNLSKRAGYANALTLSRIQKVQCERYFVRDLKYCSGGVLFVDDTDASVDTDFQSIF